MNLWYVHIHRRKGHALIEHIQGIHSRVASVVAGLNKNERRKDIFKNEDQVKILYNKYHGSLCVNGSQELCSQRGDQCSLKKR